MTGAPSWPKPPREPGPWAGGPPVAPPGNTALPPLPGPGGVSRTSAASTNPWANAESLPASGRRRPTPSRLKASALPRIDRAPRSIMVLSALVVVALVGGAVYLVVAGGRQYPSEWDKRVYPIAQWVSKTRKLPFEHPVEVRFLSASEYTKAATSGDGEGDESPQQLDDTAAQLRALGLLEGDVDLGAARDVLNDSGTMAFYSPETEVVYVRGTTLTPALRVILAHELTHVLQDQHADLQRIDRLSDNQAPVLRALAEGDAGRIEDRYRAEVLTQQERVAEELEASAVDDIDKKVADTVPAVMTTLFSSPYIFGPELIRYLDLTGGDGAIDAALEDPPSEAVLFDPLISGTPAAEAGKLDVAAPTKDKIEDGEFGPTAWYLLLAARMEPRVALRAADGLAKDGYVVYRENKRVCVRVSVEGDTPADVLELWVALKTWVAKSASGTAKIEMVDTEVRLQSCDPGIASKGSGSVTDDLLALPVTRTQLYNRSIKDGANPKQAACFARALVMEMSLAQILDGKYLLSPPGRQVINSVADRCR